MRKDDVHEELPGLKVIRQDLLVHVPSGNIMICTAKGKQKFKGLKTGQIAKVQDRCTTIKKKKREKKKRTGTGRTSPFESTCTLDRSQPSVQASHAKTLGKLMSHVWISQRFLEINTIPAMLSKTSLNLTSAFLVCPLISFHCHLRHPVLINSM